MRKKLGNITCDRIFDAEFESGVDDDTCQCKEYCDAWETQKDGGAAAHPPRCRQLGVCSPVAVGSSERGGIVVAAKSTLMLK